MKRLTKRIGEHVYYTKGKYDETIPAECEPHDVRKILQALADYEDTRHTPEECAAAFEELAAYRAAEHTVLVRCKACKFSKPWCVSEQMGNEKVLCRFHLVDQMIMPADGYCNYGELKEQEDC